MANKVIVVDTSILIDFYRKTDKTKSVWISLIREGYDFAISVITKYEIYSGATEAQIKFWDNVLEVIQILPLDEYSIDTAVSINSELKRKNKQIELADLFIAATAIANNMELASLNKKHFNRVEQLRLVN